MNERVLAVVVCYNPQAAALEVLLDAVVGQCERVLVVDNNSANCSDIKTIEQQHGDRVVLSAQDSNTGLGAAHNIGIEYAKQHGFSHILLLDQDSVPLADMVDHLLTAWRTKRQVAEVSAVGATYLNADNGTESFFVRFGLLKFRRQYCADRDADGCVEADFLISSGSLFSLHALEKIGHMDESLFIDHVDTEWFLRARAEGFQAFGVCDAVMQHGLGETTHQINLGMRKLAGRRIGRQRNVPQHKPFRYYYIFRNSVLLYKRSYVSRLWKWNDLQRLGMIAVMFGLFKAPRAENAKMMWSGVLDGLRGKSGAVTK